MLRRNRSDRAVALPPVELSRRNSVTPEERGVAEGRDDLAAVEAAQRCDVAVVVMIVADENEVDRWKILEANSGRTMATRTRECNRRNTFGPNGIGQDV